MASERLQCQQEIYTPEAPGTCIFIAWLFQLKVRGES
jgi:hypothetical protein